MTLQELCKKAGIRNFSINSLKKGESIYLLLLQARDMLELSYLLELTPDNLEKRVIEYADEQDHQKRNEIYTEMFNIKNTYYFDLAKKLYWSSNKHEDYAKINKIPKRKFEMIKNILNTECDYLDDLKENKKSIKLG